MRFYSQTKLNFIFWGVEFVSYWIANWCCSRVCKCYPPELGVAWCSGDRNRQALRLYFIISAKSRRGRGGDLPRFFIQIRKGGGSAGAFHKHVCNLYYALPMKVNSSKSYHFQIRSLDRKDDRIWNSDFGEQSIIHISNGHARIPPHPLNFNEYSGGVVDPLCVRNYSRMIVACCVVLHYEVTQITIF